MSTINKAQITAIAVMCNKANIGKEDKTVMVQGFSGGRCTSSKDLTYEEATALLKHLATMQPVDDRLTKMQNKIFHYAHEMRWTKLNRQAKVVADVKRIDQWMVKYSYLKKKMNRYTYEELPRLVSQFEQVYKSFLSNL